MEKPTCDREQDSTNQPITERYTDDLSESGEDYEFLDDKNILYLTCTEIQGMIDSAMHKYEKISWGNQRIEGFETLCEIFSKPTQEK